jgi:nickel-dependent lactate racemase
MHAGLFPTLSDHETIKRFGGSLDAESDARQRRQRKETDEVGWLLGISMIIRVVPAADGGVLAILAGKGRSVAERAQSLCDAAWDFPVPHRASLVIASIGGDDREQTWPNVARALAASRRAVAENGAIVICAELSGCPEWASGRAGDVDAVFRKLRQKRSRQVGTTAVLTGAEARGHVYLMSGLADEAVEQLGMVPVAGGDEIGRLARQHETCILLGNAQYAVPTAMEERVTTR